MVNWFQKDSILYSTSTPYHDLLEVSRENGVLVLNSRNGNFSFGSLHEVFREVFRLEKIKKQNPKSVLILGLGAGSIPALIFDELKLTPSVTGIEIDPEIIKIGCDYFAMNRHEKLAIINSDAYTWIGTNNRQFDLITVDIYIDLSVPERFHDYSFLNSILQSLAPNGKLIFNKVVRTEKEVTELDSLIQFFGKENIKEYVLFDINHILIYTQLN